MDLNKRKIFILTAFSLLLGIGLAILRTVLVINYYDVDEGLFVYRAEGVTVFSASLFISIVFLAVLSMVLIKKRDYEKLPEASHGVVFTGALCGFMSISSVVLSCFYFIKDFDTGNVNGRVSLAAFIASLVFSVLSSLYYFRCASTSTKLNVINVKIFSIAPILWAVCYLVYNYFNRTTVINSPERALTQLSVVFVLFYALCEAKFHFGMAKIKTYTAVSCCAVMVITVVCVPHFILTAFWNLPFTTNAVFSIMQISVAAYIICRLISVVNANTEK